MTTETWPDIPLAGWAETRDTLHLWTQIVGKVRLTQTPWINHSWHGTLYVTSRGLTTSLVPHGERLFAMTFDFVDHRLLVTTVEGDQTSIALVPKSVATFYREVMKALDDLGLPVEIHTHPSEIADGIPFPDDETHAAYDGEYARRFWRTLASSHRVLQKFRSTFLGKASPVHFFWGSFDLAVTRFSGRTAPERPGADAITREAYSHEVISHGWWPGGGAVNEPAFYAYAAPEPAGLKTARVEPAAAFYSTELSEFILPYEAVRRSPAPEADLRAFLTSTYGAAAQLAGWDRRTLERTVSA